MMSQQASVDRLPADVISITFAMVAEVDIPRPADNTRQPPEERGGDIGWMRLGQVNRRWRGIYLSSATLWGGIITVFPTPTIMEEIMRRSKRAPVVLDLRTIRDPQVRLSLVQKCLDRARVLREEYGVGSPMEDIWARQTLAGQRLDVLEDLNLEYAFPMEREPEEPPYVQLSSMAPLDAPFLTRAVLTTFIPLMARRLRTLTAHNVWKATVSEMVGYLGAFPALEELRLKLKIVDIPMHFAAPVPEVQLQQLRIFTNECDDFSIVHLVQRMTIPATTKLEFYLGQKDVKDAQDAHDLRTLCQTISTQLRLPSHNELIVDYDSATHLCVVPQGIVLEEYETIPVEKGVIIGGGYELSHATALACVMTEVAQTVSSLVVRNCRPDDLPVPVAIADLHPFFLSLVAVEELHVHHCSQRVYGAFLESPLFPRLKKVILDFNTSPWAGNDTHDVRWFQYLCEMLSTRQDAGYPVVEEIILTGSHSRSKCKEASECFDLDHDDVMSLCTYATKVTDERPARRPDLMDDEYVGFSRAVHEVLVAHRGL
ncbi:unnamed protein product [Peniophora sp. CBMAI 1063]|nr:unnamed protein product [Peniophora sp. CBMAI 1063]